MLTVGRSGKVALVATPADTPAAWNPLALVSFLLALVFPVGVIVAQAAGGVFQAVNASTPTAYQVGVALLKVGVLAMPLALFTGYGALDRARSRAYRQPLRALAVAGVVLGYGALLGYAIGVVLYYWGVTHQRWHLVG